VYDLDLSLRPSPTRVFREDLLVIFLMFALCRLQFVTDYWLPLIPGEGILNCLLMCLEDLFCCPGSTTWIHYLHDIPLSVEYDSEFHYFPLGTGLI